MRRYTWVAVLSVVAGVATAAEFQPLGPLAISMGGAGVASSRGSFAAYYNPALLALNRHGVEVSLGAGGGLREVNLAGAADALSDLGIDETMDAVADFAGGGAPVPAGLQNDVDVIVRELHTLAGANGLQLMPAFALGVQVRNFGFGFYGLSEGTAYAKVDEAHLGVIVEDAGAYYSYNEETGAYGVTDRATYEASSIEYAIEEGLTYMQLAGVAYAEIPLAYGHLFDTQVGAFGVGGALKIMPGYSYDVRIDVDTDSSDLSDRLADAEEKDVTFGVDLGVVYVPAALPDLAAGLVLKNVNTPEFDRQAEDSVEVKPQVRAGVAYDFLDDRLSVAMDLDLVPNETFLPGVDSQFLGGGVNYHPFTWLSVRTGLMLNLAESDDGVIFTGGLGIGCKWVQLDLSAQISTEDAEFDGNTIPRYARAQLALVSKWQ